MIQRSENYVILKMFQCDKFQHQIVKTLCKTNISNIAVFKSEYSVGFEIATPLNPSLNPSLETVTLLNAQ